MNAFAKASALESDRFKVIDMTNARIKFNQTLILFFTGTD
jgi:hypothetical protein